MTNAAISPDLSQLNALFEPLTFEQRIAKLYDFFQSDQVLMTSSFGTRSVMLLHLVQQQAPAQQVHFLDTGYHFPETLAYRDELTARLGLRLINVLPDTDRHTLTTRQEMWLNNPDRCCHYNKVLPLRQLRQPYRVWISGVMGHQTEHRQQLDIFEQREDIIKFHPLLDIDEGEFLYYTGLHDLPRHPLEKHGYGSIGCTHCTLQGTGRAGRWANSKKTECGLHLV